MTITDNILEFFVAHRAIGIVAAAICAFVSLCLIARLWILHRRARAVSKIVWSIVLLIPVFGWLFFAAFYRLPETLGWTGHAEHGRDAGYIGGGGGPM
jgi:ABC-type amino acid transport system permease subunit